MAVSVAPRLVGVGPHGDRSPAKRLKIGLANSFRATRPGDDEEVASDQNPRCVGALLTLDHEHRSSFQISEFEPVQRPRLR